MFTLIKAENKNIFVRGHLLVEQCCVIFMTKLFNSVATRHC